MLELMNENMKDPHPVEVLAFVRDDNLATVATDGCRHVTQEIELCREHASLQKAIAYLEGKGYTIDTSNFIVV